MSENIIQKEFQSISIGDASGIEGVKGRDFFSASISFPRKTLLGGG